MSDKDDKDENILPGGSADDASGDTPKSGEHSVVRFDGAFKVPAIPTEGMNDQLEQMGTSPMKTIEEDKYLDQEEADEEPDDDRGGSDVSAGSSEPSDTSGTSGFGMCNYQDITAYWIEVRLVSLYEMKILPIFDFHIYKEKHYAYQDVRKSC